MTNELSDILDPAAPARAAAAQPDSVAAPPSAIRPRVVPAPGVVARRAPLLLVSMPALNEVRTVAAVIAGVPQSIPGVGRIEVVVIDDGSTDGTADAARRAGAHVIRHTRTRGVGAAFQSALAYAVRRGADLLVSVDSDGQFDPGDIPKLIRPVLDGQAEAATASRFKDPALAPQMPVVKRWGNAAMSWLISRLTGETYSDVSCGFRCYNRQAALNLHLLGHFTYTQEVFLNLHFKHMRIVEVPLAVRGVREHGKSRVASNLFRYALRTSRIIFRSYRDYCPLQFFGALSLMMATPAVLLWIFLLIHYVTTGGFTPHKWAGFTGAALFTFGLVLGLLGVVGDMLNRQRAYLEELLYYMRAREAPDAPSETVWHAEVDS